MKNCSKINKSGRGSSILSVKTIPFAPQIKDYHLPPQLSEIIEAARRLAAY
ncbi:MAG TPA: hypothetical protein VF599_05285 [Pyrinomonadaceae bacterium]|jgi:hypothetical protein